MSGPKPLTGACDGCGRPDGINMPNSHEHYCPRCAARSDNYDMAHLHLETLLEPVLKVWREHWTARGLDEVSLDDVSKDVGGGVPADLQYRYRSPKPEAAIIPYVLQQAA